MNSRQKDHKDIILFMPRLGNSLRSIDELKINQYALASFPEINLERDENIIKLTTEVNLLPENY